MADFIAFGNGAVDAAKMVSGNCDRNGVADFLILQQDVIQKKRIEDRVAGKDNGQDQGGTKNASGQTVGDPAIVGEASGARQRLEAMLKARQRR